MVRAILDGRKTQTRRVIVPSRAFEPGTLELDDHGATVATVRKTGSRAEVPCRYGKPGDLLYVRETWRMDKELDDCSPKQAAAKCHDAGYVNAWAPIRYEADGAKVNNNWGAWGKTRVSIHMPKWASRLWLRVTDVRAERVQEIDEAGVEAEGAFDATGLHAFDCPGPYEECCGHESPEEMFGRLWDSINAKRGYGWGVDPLVRAVTFERCEAPA